MNLRFVPPELGALDTENAEVLVASVFSDVRPAKGVAGLCDWRLGGRLSRLMREGFITGSVGEVVMVPGRPATSFEKVLIFGAGERNSLNRVRLVGLVEHIASSLAGLRARAAVVEIPGRADGLIGPVEGAAIAIERIEGLGAFDEWTLIEDAAGRAAIERHVAEQRRRQQRLA